MKKNLSKKKTIDVLISVLSYLHVDQTMFSLVRSDGIEGQHFNINQLPFEVETDPNIGFSYDYYIYFQKPTWQCTHEKILALS